VDYFTTGTGNSANQGRRSEAAKGISTMSKINIRGKIGINCVSSNAHTVEIGKSYNGSGDDAFGGAEEWPTVRAKVAFQVGEELRAQRFAQKLTKLIREEFKP
jgi:hypothetical protein